MITRQWVQPVDATHRLFKASSDLTDGSGNVLVTAYPIERPDGTWSVMLVNRDPDNDHSVKVAFANAETKRESFFSGSVVQTTLGPGQFQWHPGAGTGHADPDGPPSQSTVNGGADTLYELPKASFTVLSGNLGGQQ
jgi:hypothetical protein